MGRDELQRIKRVYQDRIASDTISRYSLFRAGELFMAQERERVLLGLLAQSGIYDLSDLAILEVGCGRGHRLLDWVRWGAHPKELAGIDLIEGFLRSAQSSVPSARFALASAGAIPFRDHSFDIVSQVTVFSSVLDQRLRQAAAREIWRVLRPSGHLLWYDLRFPSPQNREVRPVGRREISELFPDAALRMRSVTLLPPLARRLAPISILACEIAAALPFLRSHYAAVLAKPESGQSSL
jgi:ubiquinone/menaquinone biosynthesis C-methylase UbiE